MLTPALAALERVDEAFATQSEQVEGQFLVVTDVVSEAVSASTLSGNQCAGTPAHRASRSPHISRAAGMQGAAGGAAIATSAAGAHV